MLQYLPGDLQRHANLVQNAIKFTPEGGAVSLQGRSQSDRVLLTVEDRCGGLKASAEELFRPFKQAGGDRTGLGLGLAIAYRSTRANGGDLYAVDLLHVRHRPAPACLKR